MFLYVLFNYLNTIYALDQGKCVFGYSTLIKCIYNNFLLLSHLFTMTYKLKISPDMGLPWQSSG